MTALAPAVRMTGISKSFSGVRALDNVILPSHDANNGVRAVEAVQANTLKNLHGV
jgi:hypothetical protein